MLKSRDECVLALGHRSNSLTMKFEDLLRGLPITASFAFLSYYFYCFVFVSDFTSFNPEHRCIPCDISRCYFVVSLGYEAY